MYYYIYGVDIAIVYKYMSSFFAVKEGRGKKFAVDDCISEICRYFAWIDSFSTARYARKKKKKKKITPTLPYTVAYDTIHDYHARACARVHVDGQKFLRDRGFAAAELLLHTCTLYVHCTYYYISMY